MPSPFLETRGLTKRYGPVTVLDQVDLDVFPAEIHGLIGANGAGKSTLCKIITGSVLPSAGTMKLGNQPYAPSSKRDAGRHGINIVHQELNLIPTLSVAENLRLTLLPATCGIIHRAELRKYARDVLDRYDLEDVDAEAPVSSLGVGRQQMVEIAASLARNGSLLILDEPTAALSGREAERLFQWLRERRSQGVTVIYISHRLAEISQLSDRISVLRDGKLVCTKPAPDVTAADMIDLMTEGARQQTDRATHRSFAGPDVVLQVRGISSGPVEDVSFHVHRGERLGITGLVGSGRTELLRAIFGADIATSGDVQLRNEAPCRFQSPSQAVAAGLAMVTEDRKQNGLLLPQSIRVNTTLSVLRKRFSARGLIQTRQEEISTSDQCTSLETRCHSIEQSVQTLSGGNQQKVAIAKWLLQDANLFLFDEPTRGIDIAARRRIYRLFESLAKEGKSIVIVSSDLEELIDTCDRIAVMSAGRLAATFDRTQWSEDKIMQAAFSRYMDPKVGRHDA